MSIIDSVSMEMERVVNEVYGDAPKRVEEMRRATLVRPCIACGECDAAPRRRICSSCISLEHAESKALTSPRSRGEGGQL